MPDESPKKTGRPPLDPAAKEQRIEFIRGLLRQSRTKGDIKRAFKAAFKIKSNVLFGRYFRFAQNRNLEAVGKTEDENLSETLSYWQRIMQECEETILRAQREDDGYNKQTAEGPIRVFGNLEHIGQAGKVLFNPESDETEKADARRSLELASERLKTNRQRVSGAHKRSMEARRELDGILGTKAPLKIARTNAKGEDVGTLTEKQLEEAMRRLGMEPLKFIEATPVQPLLITNGHTNGSHSTPELYLFDSGEHPGSGEAAR